MLRNIIRYDLKNLLAERSIQAVAALFALLLAYGLWNGIRWNEHRRTTIESVRKEQQQRLAALPGRIAQAPSQGLPAFLDPRMPSVAGGREATPYLILPPQPLSGLSVGQSDLYPFYLRASTQSASNILSADEIENPDNLLIGRFDLSFVLVYLFPLLILALSYNILSAEKEQGTLALTLSQPVSLGRLMLGKIASRAAVLLALAIGASAAAAAATGAPVLSVPFALWLAVLLVYAAFWFALAVFVNLLGKGSAVNAVLLSAVWVSLTMVVPSALHMLAGSLYPVPSRVEMIQAMREASREATAKGSTLMARYLEDHPELTPGGSSTVNAADAASRSLAVQEETERLMAPVLGRFDRQLEGQRAILQRLQYLSPAVLAQGAMNSLAGSGPERFEHFRTQTVGFLGRWRAHFARLVLAARMLTPADVERLPRFVYADEDPGAVVARVALSWLGIFIPSAVIVLLSWMRMSRTRIVSA
ncbi:hypothetical protein F183_A28510 [Bryobacterales bacterium F-183]|nr:hypothetical protein F183_A28510 [Bryobacterales bacterium F-183]